MGSIMNCRRTIALASNISMVRTNTIFFPFVIDSRDGIDKAASGWNLMFTFRERGIVALILIHTDI